MSENRMEKWSSGSAYESYVGRWSRRVAADFVDWLAVEPGATWADVGCGTGALAATILARANPAMVRGIDRSEAYATQARAGIRDARAQIEVGDACSLPWEARAFDAVVSGLVLNFVADPDAMAAEMARVTRPGGMVALYVWDYADGMQMMRRFWDVAIEQRPAASTLDEAERFPLCQPGPLEVLLARAGLASIVTRGIEIPTVFRDFDDYWAPFLSGQGPAPSYLVSLSVAAQDAIREVLRSRLPTQPDGSIRMTARAWAVKGVVLAAA